MNIFKNLWERYKASTPAGWRTAGTVCKYAGVAITGGLLHQYPELSSLLGLVAGHLMNFCFNLATVKEGGK